MSGEAVHTTRAGYCEHDPVTFTIDGTTSAGSPALVGFVGSYAAAKWSSVCVSKDSSHPYPTPNKFRRVRSIRKIFWNRNVWNENFDLFNRGRLAGSVVCTVACHPKEKSFTRTIIIITRTYKW